MTERKEMPLDAIVALALPVSIWLVVLSLGAKRSFADAIFLVHQPGPLGRALIALALAAATRHPGVAIAIGAAGFPEQKQDTTAAVLLFLLVNGAVTAPYVRWMKLRSESATTTVSL